MADAALLHSIGYGLIILAVLTILVLGNPLKKFEDTLKRWDISPNELAEDIATGIPFDDMILGKKHLISYGLFTKIITFPSIVWIFGSEGDNNTVYRLHFVLHDATEISLPVADETTGF